jgi:hypothetical protein
MAADPMFWLVAENPFEHGAHVAGDAVGSDDSDNIRRILDESAEALFAFAPVNLLGEDGAL